MDIMKLVPYARGMIAENKVRSSTQVFAVPIELLPQLNGELAVLDVELEDSGEDRYGKKYTVKVKERNALLCEWLPLGSNRTTAPDVRRGERVIIYKYADTGKYFWKEIGQDDHLRRLETVIYRFSDIPDGKSDEPLTAENCYYISISTHDGLIEVATCKSNKEPFAYKIQLNTKEGVFIVTDDVGNYVQLDSSETCITMENANKTHFRLDKDEIYAKAITNIFVEAGENMEFKAGKNVSWDIGGSRTTNIKQTDDVVAGGDVKYKSANHKVMTGNYTLEAAGAYAVNATSGTMSATMSIQGTMLVSDSVTFQGPLSANGITSSAAISGPSGTI